MNLTDTPIIQADTGLFTLTEAAQGEARFLDAGNRLYDAALLRLLWNPQDLPCENTGALP
ncbi:hypothetical protein ACFP81_00685 [Deinococcus lacus]|uniref:Uncharacterized protein n=1 Tax=Deinococcus lacus TaxID=392561 RepID=A0ABW1Y993_9DEIO